MPIKPLTVMIVQMQSQAKKSMPFYIYILKKKGPSHTVAINSK